MFSSGSKYFLGISGLSLVAAVVYAFTVNPSDLGAIAILVLMGVAFVVFTWAPPRIFLFENFAFYRYSGEFGILKDYTPYLVFK